MSHWMEIKTKVKDLKLFKDACENLGIEFSEERKTCYSRWAGKIECAGVFSDNNGGEGAVVAEKKGDGYEIVWDNYNNSLVDVVGKNCENLMRGYTTNVVKQQIDQVGMLTNETMAENGSIILEGVFL